MPFYVYNVTIESTSPGTFPAELVTSSRAWPGDTGPRHSCNIDRVQEQEYKALLDCNECNIILPAHEGEVSVAPVLEGPGH